MQMNIAKNGARSGGQRCSQGQRRGYLNLYPKPEAGVMGPFSDLTAYYQIPEYMAHKDHKQLRPVQLDRTNTSELTREEERIQRIKVMNWQQSMAKGARKASSVATDLPAWEATDEEGRGRFRETWSGAQLLEYLIRSGADLRNIDPEKELQSVDPHGASSSPAACYELTTSAVPEAFNFRSLIASTELNHLLSTYSKIAGEQFPTTGLDFPAVLRGLSKGVHEAAVSGRGLETFRKAKEFLAELTAAVHAGVVAKGSEDGVLSALAVGTALEAHVDIFSASFSHRVTGFSEQSFTALSAAYDKKGFYGALKELPESVPEYSLFLEAFNPENTSLAEVQTVANTLEELFGRYGDVMEAHHTAAVKAGKLPDRFAALDADWIRFAQDTIVTPYTTWYRSGSFPYDTFADQSEDLRSLFSTEVFKGLTFEDFLRWGGHLEQIAVPEKLANGFLKSKISAAAKEDDDDADEEFDVLADDNLDDDDDADDNIASSGERLSPILSAALPSGGPAPALAARLCNMTFHGAYTSMGDDLGAHLKILRKAHQTEVSFFQFLRCVTNAANVPSYNAAKSTAFFSSMALSGEYYAALSAARNDPSAMKNTAVLRSANFSLQHTSSGVGGVMLYDAAAVAGELFAEDERREWVSAESSAHARDMCRRDVQADLLFFALRRTLPLAKQRAASLSLARDVVADVDDCIGYLRRRLATQRTAETEKRRASDGNDLRNVAIDVDKVYTGCDAEISWEWLPTGSYSVQLSTPEQKTAAYRNLVETQNTEAVQNDSTTALVREVIDKAASFGDVDSDAQNSTRVDWAFAQMYHKWKRQGEEREVAAKLGVEQAHRVHVALYKKVATSGFRERRARVNAALKEVEEDSKETQRQTQILRQMRAWAVASFVERIEHSLGTEESSDLLAAIHAGELKAMLESDEFINTDESAQWEYQCNLLNGEETTYPNLTTLRTRIPFKRDGKVLDDGTYRVGIAGLGAEGEWVTEASSKEFEVKNTADTLVEGFLRKGRPGGRHLKEVGGRQVLLPAVEVKQALEYFKTNEEFPVSLDLAMESRIGADIINVEGKPFVHVDVLKADLMYDHHREEHKAAPIQRYLDSQTVLQKALFAARHPGCTPKEQAQLFPNFAKQYFGQEKNIGWLSHDDELTQGVFEKRDAADEPTKRFLDRKFANLFTDTSSALGSVRYEGMGYVSEMGLSEELKRMRSPLPPAQTGGEVSITDRETGRTFVVKVENNALVVVCGDDSHPARDVTFDELRWTIVLGTQDVALPSSVEADQALADLRQLCLDRTDVTCNIPAELRMQHHHYAAVCTSLINGAHTDHCLLAESTAHGKAAQDAHDLRCYPQGVGEKELAETSLPTVLNAWQDAGSEHADLSPIGVKQYRRRFDSWQLLSGSGRYDISPTKGEQWKHPIEENPTQYRFEEATTPFENF